MLQYSAHDLSFSRSTVHFRTSICHSQWRSTTATPLLSDYCGFSQHGFCSFRICGWIRRFGFDQAVPLSSCSSSVMSVCLVYGGQCAWIRYERERLDTDMNREFPFL
jgi:hypothetical protein